MVIWDISSHFWDIRYRSRAYICGTLLPESKQSNYIKYSSRPWLAIGIRRRQSRVISLVMLRTFLLHANKKVCSSMWMCVCPVAHDTCCTRYAEADSTISITRRRTQQPRHLYLVVVDWFLWCRYSAYLHIFQRPSSLSCTDATEGFYHVSLSIAVI